MSWTDSWGPYFHTSAKMRGRLYHQENRVSIDEPQGGEVVQATVKGREATYTVTIGGDSAPASATCTCPAFADGYYCKHIWATLLTLEDAPADELPPQQAQPPSPMKARKRSDSRVPVRRAEPEWVGRLSLLRLTGGGEAGGSLVLPTQQQLCYVVRPDLCLTHRGLVIELQQRQPTRTGWSRLRRTRISTSTIDELSEPIDRELCAMILGGTWVNEEEDGRLYQDDRSRTTFRLLKGAWRSMLQRMIRTGRCFIDNEQHGPLPLSWDGPEPWVLWMVGTEVGTTLDVTVELRRGEQRLPVDRPQLLLGGGDGLVISDGKAAPFDDRGAMRWVVHFREDMRGGGREPSPIRVPLEDVNRFLDRLYVIPQLPEIDLPEEISRTEQDVDPVPHLELTSGASADGPNRPANQLIAHVWFQYGQTRVNPGDTGRFAAAYATPQFDEPAGEEPEQYPGDEADEGPTVATDAPPHEGRTRLIRRKPELETQALSTLVTLGFRLAAGTDPHEMVLPTRQLMSVAPTLLSQGWVLSADQQLIRHPGPPRLSIRSGIDWFELRGSVQFHTENGDQEVGLPEILAAVRSGSNMVQLGDGSQGMLPQEWLREQGLLTTIGEWHEDHLRFKTTQAALLDALLREKPLVDVDERFEAMRQRIAEFERVEPIDPAPTFTGQLRTYQREGLGWLRFLRWFGMGGILADDMGLGKTVQVLAMLDSHYQQVRKSQAALGDGQPTESALTTDHAQPVEQLPSLIVVPRSVIFNWIDEAERFAPELRVLTYTGSDRAAMRESFKDHDLIVTSYGLMRRDIRELRHQKFEYVVLDEAQTIKNPMSQSAKGARLLEGRHRLALTGTPVENHLGDLWSIFEFLNPGMLGSGTRFAELVRGGSAAVEQQLDVDGDLESGPAVTAPPRSSEAAVQVAAAIQPFILRRTKKQVLDDLPEKTEQTILCEMSRSQRKTYDELRKHYRGTLLRQWSSQSGGMAGSSMMVLEALLRLRQACCHPALIDPKHQAEPSVKMDVLLDSLAELIDEGSKALVFSQFTSMLSLVRQRLDEQGTVYEYLDGQTRKRRERVERFQNDPDCHVFLISLKAGGLGLNLTAAEYVFILDPWWNPAVEAQAIDRTHRIGQTQHVFAYRLICKDTIEQRIIDLQQKKKELADAIVGGQENVLRNLSRDDLEALLS